MPTPLTQDYLDLVVDGTNKMRDTPSEYYIDPKAVDRHLTGVSEEIIYWANGVVNELSATKLKSITAEQLLTKAMWALTEADRYQFLLKNLLEGLKNGRTPSDMIEQYNQVGLTNIHIPAPIAHGVMPAQTSPVKPVSKIRSMLNYLARICGQLIKIAIVAAKAISDHLKAKFEVKPIVGATGFLPTVSFQIEFKALEGEIVVGECFDLLQAVFDRFS